MRNSNLFWGFLLILVGVLLLLDRLGFLGVNAWNLIWPLGLISFGVWTLVNTVFRRRPENEHAVIPLDGASRARVHARHGAGRLEIYSGASTANLLEGDFGGGLDLRTRRDGDLLDATLRMPDMAFPFFGAPGFDLSWSFGLTRDIPISLEIDLGAGEGRLDLSDLQVTDLRLKTGASSTQITLPAHAGATRAEINSGAASVRIRVPEGVAARIRARGGLASINVDTARFPSGGGYFTSADYETAANKVDLNIETGVGSVEVYS